MMAKYQCRLKDQVSYYGEEQPSATHCSLIGMKIYFLLNMSIFEVHLRTLS